MEGTVESIKAWRPAKGAPIVEEDKVYEFELVTRYEASRARDKKTDTPLGSGWPPSYSYPNHGTGWNPKAKKFENWRYIEGQPSIFVSEQPELEEYEANEIHKLLGEDENQLEFRDGRMTVRGDASGQLRLDALFVQDYYEGNDNKRRKTLPKSRLFRLNNPDEVVLKNNTERDLAFETMKDARGCTIDEMLATSFIMGIDISDTSQRGLNNIKNEFLSKAEFDPRNPKGLEFFRSVLNNPSTKIKYIFAQGLLKGIISADQIPGKLSWAKLNTPILDLTGFGSTADELTAMVMDKNKVATEAMKEVEAQLKK